MIILIALFSITFSLSFSILILNIISLMDMPITIDKMDFIRLSIWSLVTILSISGLLACLVDYFIIQLQAMPFTDIN